MQDMMFSKNYGGRSKMHPKRQRQVINHDIVFNLCLILIQCSALSRHVIKLYWT